MEKAVFHIAGPLKLRPDYWQQQNKFQNGENLKYKTIIVKTTRWYSSNRFLFCCCVCLGFFFGGAGAGDLTQDLFHVHTLYPF